MVGTDMHPEWILRPQPPNDRTKSSGFTQLIVEQPNNGNGASVQCRHHKCALLQPMEFRAAVRHVAVTKMTIVPPRDRRCRAVRRRILRPPLDHNPVAMDA